MSLTPNAHYVQPNIVPSWPAWHDGGEIMLFNKTDADQPVVHTIGADAGQQERCAFWRSMSEVNAQ